MKVGFVGIGRMGEVMAAKILDGGHTVTVYNRSPGKTDALAKKGAKVAGDLAGAAKGQDVVITMVSDDAAIRSVTHDQGLLNALDAGAVHVTMGTHSVECIKALGEDHRKAGRGFVSAPVLGRPEVVAANQGTVVPGGAPDAVAKAKPLFELIGRRVFVAGSTPESAAAVKIANNFVLGCAIEALAESFSLVRKYEVDTDVFYNVLTEGLFGGSAHKTYGGIIAKQNYDHAGFTARLGLKDANLALAAGQLVAVPLPSGNVWRDSLIDAIAHGDGEKDWAVMGRVRARAAGLKE
jgi:3-hydroxyisobutyrate dehydrogenase-like beta-hydroxyacid dehydrogenase